jgi:hypothetical protein
MNGLETKKGSAPLDERFLYYLEILRIAAKAHLESRINSALVFAAAQDELLMASIASDRHL